MYQDLGVFWKKKNPALLPERPQSTQQPEDTKDAEDTRTAVSCEGDENVHQGDDNKEPVHNIPAALQVCMFAHHKTLGYHLQKYVQFTVSTQPEATITS